MSCVTRVRSVETLELKNRNLFLMEFSFVSTGDLTKFKDSPMVIKEGVPYRIKITFKVKIPEDHFRLLDDTHSYNSESGQALISRGRFVLEL